MNSKGRDIVEKKISIKVEMNSKGSHRARVFVATSKS